MTSKEAIEIGMKIAERHKETVLQIVALGSTPEAALRGCLVSLAADIMVELEKVSPSDNR